MDIDLSRFRDAFFQEAEEHLAEMESGLLRLESSPDLEQLNAIFRGAHSIKGASGTFGFDQVMRFTLPDAPGIVMVYDFVRGEARFAFPDRGSGSRRWRPRTARAGAPGSR